jgi:hypothetical protein
VRTRSATVSGQVPTVWLRRNTLILMIAWMRIRPAASTATPPPQQRTAEVHGVPRLGRRSSGFGVGRREGTSLRHRPARSLAEVRVHTAWAARRCQVPQH